MSDDRETAYAKVNLALHVRGKRADGYHDIETVFAFCEDGDTVAADLADGISLSLSGEFGEALAGADNLVVRAAKAFQDASGSRAGAAIHLEKTLPVAAGLGGGSADAAAVLRLLNRMWDLHWPMERLETIASELGADVPACVHSTTMQGRGRGDELELAELNLAGTQVLLVNPRETLPTAEVFARWDGYDRGTLADWRHGRNDLEQAAITLAPQIASVIAWLSAQPGAQCVRMSGSGATCVALFSDQAARDHAAEGVPREWWRLATRLR